MAGSGKRTFGVKVTGIKGKKPSDPGNTSSATAATARHFGVKAPMARGIPGVSGRLESCPENCPGEYIGRTWIHSNWCRWAAVLWRGHGKTEKDWNCPFECPPLQLASGWTHQWQCLFWERTGRTPIDHAAPAGTQKVDVSSFAAMPECLKDDGVTFDKKTGKWSDGLSF